MPYFSELLIKEGRLLVDPVIATSGETSHRSDDSQRANYAIRFAAQALATQYQEDGVVNYESMRKEAEENRQAQLEDDDATRFMYCPITMAVMDEPVVANDGHTYERAAIVAWMAQGNASSPFTRAPIDEDSLIPNRQLQRLITEYTQARSAARLAPLDHGLQGPSVADIIRGFKERLKSDAEKINHFGRLAFGGSLASTILSASGDSEHGSIASLMSTTGTTGLVTYGLYAPLRTTGDAVTTGSRITTASSSGGGGGGGGQSSSNDDSSPPSEPSQLGHF